MAVDLKKLSAIMVALRNDGKHAEFDIVGEASSEIFELRKQVIGLSEMAKIRPARDGQVDIWKLMGAASGSELCGMSSEADDIRAAAIELAASREREALPLRIGSTGPSAEDRLTRYRCALLARKDLLPGTREDMAHETLAAERPVS